MIDDSVIIDFDCDREFEMTGDFKIFAPDEAVVIPFKPRIIKCQTNDSAYELPNGPDGNNVNRILQIALDYIDKGWNPLPIPYKTKAPIGKEWQNLKIDRTNASQYFNGAPQNIGVQLGAKSNNLVDCDLDCSEALQIAPLLMPMTKAVFGRKSNRYSHNLYYSDLADTVDKAAIQFKDPNQQSEDKVSLLELRVGGGGKSAQTVFPGSTHPSGEAIEWENGYNQEPLQVDGDTLLKCAKETAAACLFARYWPSVGGRHDAGLVLGGFLARCGMDLIRIKLFAEAVAKAAHADINHAKRCAEDAAKAFAENRPCFGLPQAIEVFGEKVAKKCAEWLDYKGAEEKFFKDNWQDTNWQQKKNKSVEIINLKDVKPEPICWLWQGWIAQGKLHIIAGMYGDGKSQIALEFAATLSRGGNWPDAQKAPVKDVVVWSGEDKLEDVIVPRLLRMGADMAHTYVIKSVSEDGAKREFNPATDMDMLEAAIVEITNIPIKQMTHQAA